MRSGHALFLAALSLSLTQCTSASFYLKEKWVGEDFFRDWNWETENDPTDGRVNYVSQAEAIAKNLAYVENDAFVMRADDWSIVDPSARGRDSIRISSQNAYSESIFVLDLAHMPAGCATWPAFWTNSQKGPWPDGGEVDIIEGVNLNEINQATLHTSPDCQMPPDALRQPQSGATLTANCDATVNGNEGCGVLFNNSGPSYGASFNMNGGGYYVMVRSQVGIQLYFWPRAKSAYVPTEIRELGSGGGLLDLDPSWGIPAANFPFFPNYCNYDEHFDAHQIIFDLTFCGDWAGSVWPSSGCGNSTCENYVDNNPSAFSEAYWVVNSLRVYTPEGPY